MVQAKTPPAGTATCSNKMSRSASLCGCAGERVMTAGKEKLTGPVGRKMKTQASDAADHTSPDFEQVETDGADGRRCQTRPAEDRAAEVREEQQRETVELQPKRVRAEAMTAEPVGVDVELELFDPILGGAAVDVPGQLRRGIRGA